MDRFIVVFDYDKSNAVLFKIQYGQIYSLTDKGYSEDDINLKSNMDRFIDA